MENIKVRYFGLSNMFFNIAISNPFIWLEDVKNHEGTLRWRHLAERGGTTEISVFLNYVHGYFLFLKYLDVVQEIKLYTETQFTKCFSIEIFFF